ncbi:MAG: hypothetical protein HRK26_05625 [Rickettsiaceae bacterium H1]|nr:hypothetical protein [Rickettsiaceae bacterium H1]
MGIKQLTDKFEGSSTTKKEVKSKNDDLSINSKQLHSEILSKLNQEKGNQQERVKLGTPSSTPIDKNKLTKISNNIKMEEKPLPEIMTERNNQSDLLPPTTTSNSQESDINHQLKHEQQQNGIIHTLKSFISNFKITKHEDNKLDQRRPETNIDNAKIQNAFLQQQKSK